MLWERIEVFDNHRCGTNRSPRIPIVDMLPGAHNTIPGFKQGFPRITGYLQAEFSRKIQAAS